MSSFRPEEWQYSASQRLQNLLTRATLRKLVGPFEPLLRADRRAETGEDRPSYVAELADALLVLYDIDLLAQKPIRMALSTAIRASTNININNPKNWVSGGPSARRFVEDVGLSPELAGSPTPARPEPMITVAPPAPYRTLQDYQAQVSLDMFNLIKNQEPPRNRAIMSLPTGAGKTRVAVETIHRWSHDLISEGTHKRVAIAWLAHTEELCEQAVECFEDVWRSNPNGRFGLRVARYWGEFGNKLNKPEALDELLYESTIVVVVSTPQSFEPTNGRARELNRRITMDTIVIDEAHRAAAPTYRRIIEKHGTAASIIGLTATPFGGVAPTAGAQILKSIFGNLILANTLGDTPRACLRSLQQMGVLSRPKTRTVETRLTLRVNDPPHEGDFELVKNYDKEIQKAADQTRRRRIVISEILSVLETDSSARVLYFGPSVADAELVAFLLRAKGKRASAVSGNTKDTTRRTIIDDFKTGRIDVLCNCEVLTTGFDAPQVTHVIMARPTISQVLYEQMVGRGLRGPVFGGTKHCVIVDFEDRYVPNRPTLGWAGFREIWQPSSAQTVTESEQLGLLIELSSDNVQRAMKDERGVSKLRFKPASRGLEIPVIATLEGDGSGELTIALYRGRNTPLEFVNVIKMNENANSTYTRIDVRPGYRLYLEAKTNSPGAHVEVRRSKK